MRAWIVAGTLALTGLSVSAQSTPVGLWKTIDDDGKTEKSLVRITDTGGVLSGKIEKIFDASKQDGKCDQCTDDQVRVQIARGAPPHRDHDLHRRSRLDLAHRGLERHRRITVEKSQRHDVRSRA